MTTQNPVLRRGVIGGGAFFKGKPPLYEGKYDTFKYSSLRSITLLCDINIHTYTCSFCLENVAATTSSEYCYMVLWDVTRILLCMHRIRREQVRKSDNRGGKETQTGVLLTHTHTRARGQPEHSDIDFSMLPAVGDSSLGHASRHIPIRAALEGEGFGGLKRYYRGFL